MKITELYNEVKSWLGTRSNLFCGDGETTFEVDYETKIAVHQVTLMCEEEPPILQAIAVLPLKVPPSKAEVMAVLLHKFNACIRIGHFQFMEEDGVVCFRIGLRIREAAPLHEVDAMDKAVKVLSLFVGDDEGARETQPAHQGECAMAAAHQSLAQAARPLPAAVAHSPGQSASSPQRQQFGWVATHRNLPSNQLRGGAVGLGFGSELFGGAGPGGD